MPCWLQVQLEAERGHLSCLLVPVLLRQNSASCPACCRAAGPGCAGWLPASELCCSQHKVQPLAPCRVAKADGSELGTADLRVGTPVPLYGRMFHIVGCDAFTRTFLEEQGVAMPEDLEWPLEPREVAKQVGLPSRGCSVTPKSQWSGRALPEGHNWQLEQREIVQQECRLQGTAPDGCEDWEGLHTYL